MDLLKSIIAQKKEENDGIKQRLNLDGSKRYIKQSDLQALKRRDMERDDENIKALKRSRREENEGQKLEPKMESAKKEEEVEELQLTPLEVKVKLREFGQPITYFGEGEEERLARLRRVVLEDEGEDDFGLKSGFAIRNRMLDGGEEEDDEEDEEDGRPGVDGGVGKKREMVEPDIRSDFSSREGWSDPKIILRYFKVWEWDLNKRSDDEKKSMKGKLETKQQKQCKDYMRPLFRLCKKGQVPDNLSSGLIEMVKKCEEGDFVGACTAYFDIAIGRAAWPMGLTMVGIHERKARDQISSRNIAHVMNNELQRKYLTSAKVLIDFAQTKREDVPPSMKVNL